MPKKFSELTNITDKEKYEKYTDYNIVGIYKDAGNNKNCTISADLLVKSFGNESISGVKTFSDKTTFNGETEFNDVIKNKDGVVNFNSAISTTNDIVARRIYFNIPKGASNVINMQQTGVEISSQPHIPEYSFSHYIRFCGIKQDISTAQIEAYRGETGLNTLKISNQPPKGGLGNEAFIKLSSTKENINKVEVNSPTAGSDDNQIATTKFVNDNIALNGVPIGTVVPFAGSVLPNGWLWCDGKSYNANDPEYNELFRVLNGVATARPLRNGYDTGTFFNVPILNDNRFIEGGETYGVYKDAGLPNLKGYARPVGQDGTADGKLFSVKKAVGMSGYAYLDNKDTKFEFNANSYSGVYKDDIKTVQPKSLTMRYIIKYKNII